MNSGLDPALSSQSMDASGLDAFSALPLDLPTMVDHLLASSPVTLDHLADYQEAIPQASDHAWMSAADGSHLADTGSSSVDPSALIDQIHDLTVHDSLTHDLSDFVPADHILHSDFSFHAVDAPP